MERLWTGGRWLEGLVWFGDGALLLFSDIPNNRMRAGARKRGDHRLSATRGQQQRQHRDRQGRLIMVST